MLAFHQQALVRAREVVAGIEHEGQVGWSLFLHVASGIAALHAVLAGGGQAQGGEEAVEHVDLPARHHRERTA